jgi:tripartite-type tricarboxylate transporter receptor subunit TctC
MFGRRRFAALLGTSLLAAPARADDFPIKPITLVVPFTPGGSIDMLARLVAQQASATLGQPIVIDNRSGAGGLIAAAAVAKAEPDGYMLLLGQSGPISINPAVYKTLPYDPAKDLVPITMTNSYPYVLVVNGKLGPQTLQEFVALGKARPGSMNYGTTGVGAANHLVSELFCREAGLKMTHIPYRGTALAVADLVAGQVTLVFSDPVSALPHIQAGTLRALAVTSPQRSPVMAQLPTMIEAGYPKMEAVAWLGIFAPAGSPQAVID